MKRCVLGIFLFLSGLSAHGQNLRHSVLNLNAGIASPTGRWDSEFDVFDPFFVDITSLSVSAGPRLYSKNAWQGGLSYLHNLESSFSFKTELYGHFTRIGVNFPESYADSLNINLNDFGLALYGVKNFKLGSGNFITLQLGVGLGSASLGNGELINRVDTTDLFGFTSIIQASKMQMELVDQLMLRGIAKVEWFSRLNDEWSVSAAFAYMQPLSGNTRFTAQSTLETAFFPLNTTYNTSNFSMSFWSISAGIVRNMYFKKKQNSVPGF